MSIAFDRPDLPAAQTRFADAVHELVGRRSTWLDRDDDSESIVFGDSRWQQLIDYRPGGTGDRGITAARSVPPIAVDAVSLIDGIDRAVRAWTIDGLHTDGDTPHRLHQLADHPHAPHHIDGLHSCADQIATWCKRIDDLLDPPKRQMISAPCPACNETHVYRPDSAGENVRQPALQLGPLGCECQACNTTWGPEQYLFLSTKLLGFERPEGVLE